MFNKIIEELRHHAPFTFFGALTGIIVMLFAHKLPQQVSYNVFYILHPIHVVLSAIVTASMYEFYRCSVNRAKCNLGTLFIIGYVGSVGI